MRACPSRSEGFAAFGFFDLDPISILHPRCDGRPYLPCALGTADEEADDLRLNLNSTL